MSEGARADGLVDTLPDNQRRALLLREWRGLSYREIAIELRCSVGAVETLIFRARRNMAQALSQTKSRIAGVLDLGSLVGALKTMFGGATGRQGRRGAAVVTVATLPAGDAPQAAEEPRRPEDGAQMPSTTDLGRSGRCASAVTGSRADKQPGTERQGQARTVRGAQERSRRAAAVAARSERASPSRAIGRGVQCSGDASDHAADHSGSAAPVVELPQVSRAALRAAGAIAYGDPGSGAPGPAGASGAAADRDSNPAAP